MMSDSGSIWKGEFTGFVDRSNIVLEIEQSR